MVVVSSYPDLVIPKLSFYEYMMNMMKPHGDNVALVDASTGHQLTFNEIRDFSFKFASALTRKGLKKQEVVALCTSNCVEYPIVILGAVACNAITTTCNPHYTLDETLKQFQSCKPKFVITDSSEVNKMLEIAKKVPSIQEVFSIEPDEKCDSLLNLIENDNGKSFPFNTSVVVEEDIVILPYSSGTTGLPKGVMLTHYNMVAMFVLIRGFGKAAPWSVHYTVVPMFHIYGIMRIFHFLTGFKHIIAKRFGVKSFLEAVERYKINSMGAVPPMLIQLNNSPLLKNYDLSSLAVLGSGAAPLAPNVAASTMKKMQALIVQGWGLTEVLSLTSSMPGAPLNSVGFVAPNTAIKVVDPITKKELGVNQDGELLVKGPQVMKGYYNNPKANAATFDEEGWLRTGDIGHYDKHGLFYIVDRLKELIKYKGFQVAPAELESLLLEHPDVLDVGVVGVPDKAAGQLPKAYVVRRVSSLTESQLDKFVQDKVSRYKYLRGGIQFVKEIPKTATGKILRRKLNQMYGNSQAKL